MIKTNRLSGVCIISQILYNQRFLININSKVLNIGAFLFKAFAILFLELILNSK